MIKSAQLMEATPTSLAQQDILDRIEAATYLRISVSKLDGLVRSGELTPGRIGRRVLFPRPVLVAYVNKASR